MAQNTEKGQECDHHNLDEKCAADPSTPKHQGDLWAPAGNINASPFARASGIIAWRCFSQGHVA